MSEHHGARPTKFGLDLTFNLGHVIIIVTALTGFISSHYLTDWRIAALEKRIEGYSGLLVDSAVTAQRMREVERRLEFVERR